jgi:glutathione S-transferase
VPRLISEQETRTPPHLTLNPDGKVPVLVTESRRVLTEVAATLYYIARKISNLAPVARRRSGDEANVISWMLFAASTMHGSRARGSDHVANAFAAPTESSVTANGLSAATRLPTHICSA